MALQYIPSQTFVIINGGQLTHLAMDDYYSYDQENDLVSWKTDLKQNLTIIPQPARLSRLTLRLVDGGYTQNILVSLLEKLIKPGATQIENTITIGNDSISTDANEKLHWECSQCFLIKEPGSTGSSDGNSDIELSFICQDAITYKRGYQSTAQVR